MLGDTLHRSRIAASALMTIAGSLLLSASATAQQASTADPLEDTLLEMIVTGSRIKRIETEGPAPVTVITREQLEREGFTTASEAIYSLTQSTGSELTQQLLSGQGNPTANATSVDLRGLGPGRTLVLFNGRRAADYPLPLNGQSNLVNLSAIPVAAIERIEVLSSGASAVYGSDAVAGVINFVMRDHFDGIEIAVRGGRRYDGGGDSERVQLTGGLNGESFTGVYALEYLNRDPLWAMDNRHYDSLADVRNSNGPTARMVAGLVRVSLSTFQGSFVSPTAADCQQFGDGVGIFPGGTRGVSQAPFPGLVCAGQRGPAQRMIRNDTEAVSGFFNGRYEFGDNLQAFGTLSLWQSDAGNTPQLPVWQGPGSVGVILDVGPNSGGGALLGPARFFQLSEATRDPLQKFDELAWDAALGLRGTIAGKFDWELAYHRSDYEVERDYRQLLESATNSFFQLGPQLGSLPFAGLELPIFAVADYSRMLRPLTPAEFRSITALNHTEADSSNDQVSAVFSGDLFKLPAGAVKFASVLEWGTQDYQIDLDPREVNAEFTGFGTSFPGGGSRDRYAAGVEFAVPVIESVRMTLAGRYDKYDDVTDVDDAFTYNFGLEYRPLKSLLLRGSYATSFRAPDMHFVFAGASSTFSSPRDMLRCRRDFGVTDINQCGFLPGLTGLTNTERTGNRALEEETSKSWTAGLAWNITESLDLSVDYFDIQIEDMVNDLSVDFITQTEADCVLGETISGQVVNSSSALCQFITGLVTRATAVPPLSPDSIVELSTLPINRAFEAVTGLDASLNYSLDAKAWGRFFFNLGWSHVLKQERQEFAGDPVDSYRDDRRNRDLRSKIRSSLTWEKGGFSQTLFADRQGSRPTYAFAFTASPSDFRTDSYTVYNYTASYTSAADTWRVGLIVSNVLDEDPKIDATWADYPFFFTQNVNAFGREVLVEASYKFK